MASQSRYTSSVADALLGWPFSCQGKETGQAAGKPVGLGLHNATRRCTVNVEAQQDLASACKEALAASIDKGQCCKAHVAAQVLQFGPCTCW